MKDDKHATYWLSKKPQDSTDTPILFMEMCTNNFISIEILYAINIYLGAT